LNVSERELLSDTAAIHEPAEAGLDSIIDLIASYRP
jgi:hypothetical protein